MRTGCTIKAVLFDCDGTLVDSERLCNQGLAELLGEVGAEISIEDLVRDYRGRKLSETLATVESSFGVTLGETFVVRYRQRVSELFEQQLQPTDGIHDALRGMEHKMAVVSSGPMHKIRQSLSLCALLEHFGDHVYSSFDVGIWKPDPGIYLHAARALGVPAEHCAVVEDSLVGVQAGVNAGMKTFFYNRFAEPLPHDSVVSFRDMRELPSLINRHNGDQRSS